MKIKNVIIFHELVINIESKSICDYTNIVNEMLCKNVTFSFCLVSLNFETDF